MLIVSRDVRLGMRYIWGWRMSSRIHNTLPSSILLLRHWIILMGAHFVGLIGKYIHLCCIARRHALSFVSYMRANVMRVHVWLGEGQNWCLCCAEVCSRIGSVQCVHHTLRFCSGWLACSFHLCLVLMVPAAYVFLWLPYRLVIEARRREKEYSITVYIHSYE